MLPAAIRSNMGAKRASKSASSAPLTASCWAVGIVLIDSLRTGSQHSRLSVAHAPLQPTKADNDICRCAYRVLTHATCIANLTRPVKFVQIDYWSAHTALFILGAQSALFA